MKKYYAFAFLAFAFLLSNAQYAWVNKNPFSGAARFKSGNFSVNGKGYVVGGRTDSSPLTYVKDTWEYDPTTDTWSAKAAFNYNVVQPFSFSIGSKGYIVGGQNSSFAYVDNTYEFDPVANTWTAKAAYPETGGAGFSLVINGKAYVGGGARASNMGNTVYEYNPANNTWTGKASYPGAISGNQLGFVVGNYGYAGMGTDGAGNLNKEMYRYDPVGDSWSAIATFPGKERIEAVAFVVDGRAFVGGGARIIAGNYYSLNDFYEYNPTTNTWSDAPSLPGVPKAHSAYFVISNSAYVVNGFDYDGDSYYTSVHEFGSCSTISGMADYSNDNNQHFSVYPNPSTDKVNVKIDGDVNSVVQYDVYTVDGKLVKSGSTEKNLFDFNVSGFSNGVYVISLQSDSGKKSVSRFEILH